MRLYLMKAAANWKSLGSRVLAAIVLFQMGLWTFSIITRLTLFLEKIFFVKFSRVEVNRPVFIIGHPRSGTTFVHHLFTQTGEMAAFKMWHLFCLSLTIRTLLKPLIRFLVRKNKHVLVPEEGGHRIALDQVEEEELLLFLHTLDSQMLTYTLLGLLEYDFRDFRFHDLQPKRRRIKSVNFLKGCFQRQIYYTGNTQIFAQMHFSTHRIKSLLEVFPDARFIYLDRTPYDVLPSHYSFVSSGFTQNEKFLKILPSQIRRFFEYRYQASIDLYRYFYDIWKNREIDRDRILIIPYDLLQNDLMNTFNTIVAFAGIEPSVELKSAVGRQAEKQSQYKRKHTVKKLEEFGIDEDRIKVDFSFYLKKDRFSE